MMRAPVVSARRVVLTPDLEAEILRRAQQLERFFPRLIGCSVKVEGPGRRHRSGGPYEVRIELSVPGAEPVIVDRQVGERLDLVVGRAFDAAERQLGELARMRNGDARARLPEPVSTGL